MTLKTTDGDETKEIEISRELAIEIHRLWMKCLLQTTYAKKKYRGLDGSDYFFASGHIQFGYHGVIWSPRPNTIPRGMVEFADDFFNSAKKGKQFSPVEEQRIFAKIHALEEKINHNQAGDSNSE